jgi:hypothetical protein
MATLTVVLAPKESSRGALKICAAPHLFYHSVKIIFDRMVKILVVSDQKTDRRGKNDNQPQRKRDRGRPAARPGAPGKLL